MTDQKPLTDRARLRAFAQGWIDEGDHIVDQCGVVGGHIEVARAEIARKLIAEIDKLPAIDAYERIPPLVLEGLDNYRRRGARPGSFLASVLASDLSGAIARGTEQAVLALPAIMAWVKAELPGDAWGSYAYVDEWCRRPRS